MPSPPYAIVFFDAHDNPSKKLIQKDESLGDYFAECIDDWTKHETCRGIIKSVILEMINISDTNAQKGLVNLIQGSGWNLLDQNY